MIFEQTKETSWLTTCSITCVPRLCLIMQAHWLIYGHCASFSRLNEAQRVYKQIELTKKKENTNQKKKEIKSITTATASELHEQNRKSK